MEQWADAERSWWEQSVGGQRGTGSTSSRAMVERWPQRVKIGLDTPLKSLMSQVATVGGTASRECGRGGRESVPSGSGVVRLYTIERKPTCGLNLNRGPK